MGRRGRLCRACVNGPCGSCGLAARGLAGRPGEQASTALFARVSWRPAGAPGERLLLYPISQLLSERRSFAMSGRGQPSLRSDTYRHIHLLARLSRFFCAAAARQCGASATRDFNCRHLRNLGWQFKNAVFSPELTPGYGRCIVRNLRKLAQWKPPAAALSPYATDGTEHAPRNGARCRREEPGGRVRTPVAIEAMPDMPDHQSSVSRRSDPSDGPTARSGRHAPAQE